MTGHRRWVLVGLLAGSACARGVVPESFDAVDTLELERAEPEDTVDLGSPTPPGPCLIGARDVPCFRASMLLSVSPDARWPRVADVTGDGIDDLVLANAAVGIVQVLSAPGWGGFEREIVLSVGSAIGSMLTTDLDGDGVEDVVVHARGEARITVNWGGELGHEPWSIELADEPVVLGARPVDASRHALVIGFGTGALHSLDLGADPELGPAIVIPGVPIQLAPSHPGLTAPPIVTVDEAGTIAVLPSTGTTAQILGAGALAATFGDVTGDDRPDVAFRPLEGPPRLLRDLAGPALALPGNADAVAITLADLDDDGRPEIVWADADARLHVAGWDDDRLVERLTLELQHPPTALAAGDLDADGWPDIVAVSAPTRTVEILARRR